MWQQHNDRTTMEARLFMLDFKTMDNATLAASLALYNRWRKGVGEFADFKKQLPYKPSELTALMNEIIDRLEQ
jgi:hypothetical protein